MAAILELPPKGDKNVTDAVEELLRQAVRDRNVNQVGWWVTDAFIQGMRDFSVVSLEQGQLNASFEELDGDVHLRWEEALTKIMQETGKLMRLDVAPKTGKRQHSLESLRNSSLSQVVLDQQESLVDSRQHFQQFATGLVLYGTYGIASWRDETKPSPLSHVREVIPPWELLGMPAGYSNPTDLRAIARTRLFPISQLAKQPGVKLPSDDRNLNILELPYGSTVLGNLSGGGVSGFGSEASLFDDDLSDNRLRGADGKPLTTAAAKKRFKPGRTFEKLVRLRELYILGPRMTVARYIARAGREVVLDIPYLEQDITVPFPIGIARYQDTGHFYGRSFAGKIISIALELEALLERLIANAADFDRFGFTLVPLDRGIDFEAFKATEEPRIIGYESDPTTPQSGVEQVLPTTANDLPGKVMQFGLNLLDRISVQGPLDRGAAPGRTDSEDALSLLRQTGSGHLAGTAQSIRAAYAQMYRFMLHEVRQRFREPGQLGGGLALTRIENSIAGVSLDANTGKIRLEPDQLPDPYSIEIGIRSEDITGDDRRRQEAPQLLRVGLLTPLEFIIMNYREGWDFPIGNRAVWENYVKAVLYNLILFNDGKTPGELPGAVPAAGILGQMFMQGVDKPEVHLQAVEDFVAGPEFPLASVAIQNVFFQRIRELKIEMGGNIPEGLPTIQDAAVQSAALRASQEQQAAAQAQGVGGTQVPPQIRGA